MQTSLRLNDALYRRAKAKAAEQGITLSRFIEEGLELRIAQPPQPVQREIHLPTFDSGHRYDTSPEELKRIGQETDWGAELELSAGR